VLASTLWATHGPDSLHASLAMAAELGAVADATGDRVLRVLAHRWQLDFLGELGDVEAVERELEALRRLAAPPRDRQFTWVLTMLGASRAHLAGRLEECERLAHAALSHSFEGRDENAAQIFAVQMFLVRREQGRLDELVDGMEGLARHYPQVPGWRCALAFVYAQLNRRAEARGELAALAAGLADLQRDTMWLANLALLGEAAASLGEAEHAQPLYELLAPYSDRCLIIPGLHCEGSTARVLGLLATTLGRHDDAARHFERALEINARIRSPLWLAHTQHDYARLLLLRDRADDRDRAGAQLADALATAQRLSLTALVGRAGPLLAEAGAAPPPVSRPA